MQFIPPSQPVTPGKQLPTSIPLPVLPAVEAAKRLAAFTAVDRHVGLEDKVGERMGEQRSEWLTCRLSVLDLDLPCPTWLTGAARRAVMRTEPESSSLRVGRTQRKQRAGLTSGFQSKELIINAGLTLGDVDQYPNLDVTIDGADE